jgi:hypothetical protein
MEIEAENTTSHLAGFAAYELAPRFSIEDVRESYERVNAGLDVTEDPVDFFGRPSSRRPRGAGTGAAPQSTTVIPLNELSGRYVIVCTEDVSPDTGQDEPIGHPPGLQQAPPPWTYYVAGEFEIR